MTLCPCLVVSAKQQCEAFQDFESAFEIVSHPEEFLPGWTGNEVRSGSSRIFQITGEGVNKSQALAVQTIGSFDGEIRISLDLEDLSEGVVRFQSKTLRNGSGTRGVDVFYSWGIGNDFGQSQRLGDENEFGNEDTGFTQYELAIPEGFLGEIAILKIEIIYGEGSGSAARWIMDDFEYGFFPRDTIPPELIQVRGYDENQIELRFSEPIDPVFAVLPINYQVEGLEPVMAELRTDSLVYLSFENGLQEGQNYELNVQSIFDLSGNTLVDASQGFTFFDPTDIPRKGLVINELMPAPKSDLDLPNVEYIELFHIGDKDYRLDSFFLVVNDKQVLIPEFWIEPDELVLLVPGNKLEEMVPYGRVIGAPNWPTLLNSGGTIEVFNLEGIIDQISYDRTSWGDSELADSGFSLEVVNPYLTCDQSLFLRPSDDPKRGSPGQINSVLDLTPDEKGPRLIQASIIAEYQISLLFDEPISSQSPWDGLSIEGGIRSDSIFVKGNRVEYFLAQSLEEDARFSINSLALFDCSGNPFEGALPIEIVYPRRAQSGEIKLNEILFNPITGDPKFVELANDTDSYLSLRGWALASLDDLDLIDDVRVFEDEIAILSPKSFLAITTDTTALKSRYPLSQNGNFLQLNSLPSYPISGGKVVLLDSLGEVQENFAFNEDLHHPLLRDPKGVSLERVSLVSPIDFEDNWQSASESQGFATPGRKNSQVLSGEYLSESIRIDPEVFDPEGSNGQTFTTISYAFDQTGWIGSFRLYDLAGRLVASLAENAVLGTEGFYIWIGTDSEGKALPIGYYVLLVELFDPSGKTEVIKRTIVVARRL